jgi:hypothetical protein
MFALPMNQVGPPWAGNQLANYVTELVTACEDRAQELGYEALTRPIGCYDPAPEYRAAFDQALQATVAGLRALIAQTLQGTWGRGQVDQLAAGNPMVMPLGAGGFPTFSQAPTAGQYAAWQMFETSFVPHCTSRVMPLLQQGLPAV